MRQTIWLFTQRSRVELGEAKNKSSKWQGRGLEHGTIRLQVQHPNHSASWPPLQLLLIRVK